VIGMRNPAPDAWGDYDRDDPYPLFARVQADGPLIALTALHSRFPAMRLAVPRSALRWGHGDGLVLRGLSELPVILHP
jgi:hypothetical protein